MIQFKRAYEAPEKGDGRRFLVDRLWPRGISRQKLEIEEWYKELSPSNELRKWYDHDPEKWDEFRRRYRAELRSEEQERLMERLAEIAARETVTLVYSSKNKEINNAVALADFIAAMASETGQRAAEA